MEAAQAMPQEIVDILARFAGETSYGDIPETARIV